MSEITVVIPNYNGMKYLPECLEALQNQELGTPDFTVLVVDNGSADGSVAFLKKAESDSGQTMESRAKSEQYKPLGQEAQAQSVQHKPLGQEAQAQSMQPKPPQSPCVKNIFLQENTGFCHAVNVGIEASDSPYVILLNNDTKVYPDFVKNLYHAIKEDTNIFSVSSRMLMWDRPELIDDAGDNYNVLGWAYARGKGKEAASFNKPCDVFAACGGASIYRKSVFEKIGLFDEEHFAYLEDLDIGYRARIHGYRNLYEPSANVLHFGSASTGSRYNQRKTELASANNIYVIGKNMPFLQLLINLPFLILGFLIKTLFFYKKGMGSTYLKGLWRGVKRCFSPVGRGKHILFRWSHLGNYVKIQWELYLNTFRILMKS